jgi:hypothetical protein
MARMQPLRRPGSIGSAPHVQSGSPRFLIGRDHRGNWVVRDREGLSGGLFVNRAEALRFALLENGGGPQAAIMVPGTLELDVNSSVGDAVIDSSRVGSDD